MRTKVFLIAVVVAAAAAVAVAVAAPFVLRRAAVRSLEQFFPGSLVSVEKCAWRGAGLVLEGIGITRDPLYKIRIASVSAAVTPGSLLAGRLDRCVISGADISLMIPRTMIARAGQLVSVPLAPASQKKSTSSATRTFPLQTLEISGARVAVRARDLTLRAEFSCVADIPGAEIEDVDAAVAFFEGFNVFLKDARFTAGQHRAGWCTVPRGRILKAWFSGLQSRVELKGDTLSLPGGEVRLLQGDMRTEVTVALEPPFGYRVSLSARTLSLSEFVKDFELEKSMSMQGAMSGALGIVGRAGVIPEFTGGLTAEAPGGRVQVKDETMLASMAQSSGDNLAMSLVMTSLRDFPFATGSLKMNADKRDLTLAFTFEGGGSRISFPMVLHLATEGGEQK